MNFNYDWSPEFPDPICMICGKECDITEVVSVASLGHGPPLELWCYCEKCKVDTFHPPVERPTTPDSAGAAP